MRLQGKKSLTKKCGFQVALRIALISLVLLRFALFLVNEKTHLREPDRVPSDQDLILAIDDSDDISKPAAPLPTEETPSSWCSRVHQARQNLSSFPQLQISYPCEHLKPAKSAIVCVLTGGSQSQYLGDKRVFPASNYVDSVVALGASIMMVLDDDSHAEVTTATSNQTYHTSIDPEETHMLLLLLESFELSSIDKARVEAVGWTVGTTPTFPLAKEYIPRFPRYKDVYTKLNVVGLAEYDCVLLVDADTLVVGDLRDIMTCASVISQPQHRLAVALDLGPKSWWMFNSGVILWKSSTVEMKRLYQHSQNSSFMMRYTSDQNFLNDAYPERLNKTINWYLAEGGNPTKVLSPNGAVISLPFEYNMQTHVEVRIKRYWKRHRRRAKILHFTQRKGWQCAPRYEPLDEAGLLKASKCKFDINYVHVEWDNHPLCYCVDAHLWWKALARAQNASLLLAIDS